MTRRTAPESKPIDLDDATPYVAILTAVQYQEANEQHPDWPDQIRFTWDVGDSVGSGVQELWTWASIKLGQTRGGKVSKLRTILNALAGRKPGDPIAWLEDGSDGEPIAWGYPDGVQVAADKGLQLRIVGHNEDNGDGSTKFVVDQYAAPARSSSRTAQAPREEVVATGTPF